MKNNQKKMDNHNGSFYSGFTADNCRFFTARYKTAGRGHSGRADCGGQ